jgi:RNA recognition motif-containing protein
MVQHIKIYVGNVPQTARNSELKELFEKFGKVVECDILKEFAFVHMDDTNDAKAAIAGLNDSLWKGSRIRVELSTTKTNKGEPSNRYKNHDDLSLDIRQRRRSNERDRDRGRNYHHNSFTSRVPDPYYRDERPYDRYNQGPPHPHHRYAKNDLGPTRDSRYGSTISSRGYMPDRGRPYPDVYDRNGGIASRMYAPGGYGSYPPPLPPYRSGSPNDFPRDRNLDYPDPYMRPPPMGHYPPLNQGYPYRGPAIPR